MGGSKVDFLDGEDAHSIASSYSSINGPTLFRQDPKIINTMSRFNPARSSFISKSSSKMDVDSLSKEGDNTRNDDDFLDENVSNEFDRDDSANGSSTQFQRRNSSKFSRTGSTLSRHLSKRVSADATVNNVNTNKNNSSSDHGIHESSAEHSEMTASGLHIAPLLPFATSTSTSTPTMPAKNNHQNGAEQRLR